MIHTWHSFFFFTPNPSSVCGLEHLFLLIFMSVKASNHNSITCHFLAMLVNQLSQSQLESLAGFDFTKSLISFPTEAKYFQRQGNPVPLHFFLREVLALFRAPRARTFNIYSWCLFTSFWSSFLLLSEFNYSAAFIHERQYYLLSFIFC